VDQLALLNEVSDDIQREEEDRVAADGEQLVHELDLRIQRLPRQDRLQVGDGESYRIDGRQERVDLGVDVKKSALMLFLVVFLIDFQ
jgi:hypothetical protein